MLCPFCGFLEDKVIDSRESKEGDSIRRRRECLKCAKRFTTYERIDEIPYMVISTIAGKMLHPGYNGIEMAPYHYEEEAPSMTIALHCEVARVSNQCMCRW